MSSFSNVDVLRHDTKEAATKVPPPSQLESTMKDNTSSLSSSPLSTTCSSSTGTNSNNNQTTITCNNNNNDDHNNNNKHHSTRPHRGNNESNNSFEVIRIVKILLLIKRIPNVHYQQQHTCQYKQQLQHKQHHQYLDSTVLAVFRRKKDGKSRYEYLSTWDMDNKILIKWHTTDGNEPVEASSMNDIVDSA